MSLKAILESHPIKNLNAIIKEVKSDIAPKLALSKAKKRHSKAKLIEHILALDEMGLLKERPTMYEKPVRAKKDKAEPKVEDKPKKKIKFKVKNPAKKEKPAGLIALESIDLEAEEAKDKSKKEKAKAKKPPTAWNKYVKKMGGVKKAAADKAGFEKFKKSL